MLYNGLPTFPLKIPLRVGDLGSHVIHGSLFPLKGHLDRFSRYRDRQTDGQKRYSVCNNTLHLRMVLRGGLKRKRKGTISPICSWDAPTEAIVMNFDVQGDVADTVTRVKFCINRFRGFGFLTPSILPFSIGLTGRSYNCVSTVPCFIVMCKIFWTWQ